MVGNYSGGSCLSVSVCTVTILDVLELRATIATVLLYALTTESDFVPYLLYGYGYAYVTCKHYFPNHTGVTIMHNVWNHAFSFGS